jgi:L,D-peptidoglycan transpeptidase YkuD (ErfK/YbiS/YcfS/YnhG family)
VNPVPAYAVSRIPASAVNPVPAYAVSRIPASTVNPVPAYAVSRIPASAVNPVPVNAVSRIPASAVSPVPANAGSNIWLLVDTKAHKIEVKRGEQTLETLNGIAIGRKGAGLKAHRGDDITPYGNYRIGWVGEKSNFRKFFGLTYPSTQDAKIALKRGVISQSDYYSIAAAEQYNQIPPQNTPLGGQIGIHGLGAGDERVHQAFDWTHGCIALTNNQIDQLSQWLDTGTVVKIK